VVVAGFIALVQLRRDPEKRAKVRAWLDERKDKPGWRPVARLARPAWRVVGRPAAWAADVTTRFGLDRLTPGGLGLELTTLLALFTVGTFSFFFIGDIVSQPGLPRIDELAADLADRLAMDPLIDLAKVLTELGALPTVIAIALVTATWAGVRGRWIDVATIVTGVLLSFVVVNVAKAAYDRVRPEDALVGYSDASYPSGHTAYAVAWVACAAVLVRAGSGWAARFAAVTVSIAIVVVVGLTRVYLGVHHFTDVLGGAALAAALWALVGTFALVAGYVRHNGSRDR